MSGFGTNDGLDDADQVALLQNIFDDMKPDGSGKVPVLPLAERLAALGLPEQEVRNFEERCDLLELDRVAFNDFVEFFRDADDADETMDSPQDNQRYSASSLPSPHHTSDVITPTRGKRGSLHRVRSIHIMASNQRQGRRPVKRMDSHGVLVAEDVLHLMRSNKMKRQRVEKAQYLLNQLQHRLELLTDELNTIDENDTSHSERERIAIRRNHELQAKVDALKKQIAKYNSSQEQLESDLTQHKQAIKALTSAVDETKKLRTTLQRRRSTLAQEALKQQEANSSQAQKLLKAQKLYLLAESELQTRSDEVEDLRASIAHQQQSIDRLQKKIHENGVTKVSLQDSLTALQTRSPQPRRRMKRSKSAFKATKDVNPNVRKLREQTQQLCRRIGQIEGIESRATRDTFAEELLIELKQGSQDMKPKVMTPRRYSSLQRDKSMARFKKMMVHKVSMTNLTAMSQSLVEEENSADEDDEEDEDEDEDTPPPQLTRHESQQLLVQLLSQAVKQCAADSKKREDEINNATTKVGSDGPEVEEGGFLCSNCEYANAFFRLTCRRCGTRRYKYIGGMERTRLAARARYVDEKLAKRGDNRFYLAHKKGFEWHLREYRIEVDGFACEANSKSKGAFSPAKAHEERKKQKGQRQTSAVQRRVLFKRLKYGTMVDIRCDKRTVEIALSPNIPPTLMRSMLMADFERKVHRALEKKNSRLKNLPINDDPDVSEGDNDLLSKMPALEEYGEVVVKRFKAANEADAKKCVLMMTKARDCWAAQEFLRREEAERLRNCALWLEIIFKKYKNILTDILRNEENGKMVLTAEARIVRDKRLRGLGQVPKDGQKRFGDETIDQCDTALAEAKVINMLQEATEGRGGKQFDKVYPPYMEHQTRAQVHAQITPVKPLPKAKNGGRSPPNQARRRSSGSKSPMKEPRHSASLDAVEKMTVKGVLANAKKPTKAARDKAAAPASPAAPAEVNSNSSTPTHADV